MNKQKPFNTIYSVGFDRSLPPFLTEQSVKLNFGRDKVICGGCLNGMIKVQREDSRFEMVSHESCQGLGWRINKRFGRPLKGKPRSS